MNNQNDNSNSLVTAELGVLRLEITTQNGKYSVDDLISLSRLLDGYIQSVRVLNPNNHQQDVRPVHSVQYRTCRTPHFSEQSGVSSRTMNSLSPNQDPENLY